MAKTACAKEGVARYGFPSGAPEEPAGLEKLSRLEHDY